MQTSELAEKPCLTLADLAASMGREIAVSDWLTVDQSRIDAFAACTGDRQWIHTDPERARTESSYGQTIAHGFLTLSLLAELQRNAGLWPANVVSTLNYGLESVRFVSPVLSGARIRNRAVCASVTRRSDVAWLVRVDNTMEIEGQTKPALVAGSLLMMITEEGA